VLSLHDGRRPSSIPRRKTTSYSNPLAECSVIRFKWSGEPALPEKVAIVAFSSSFPSPVNLSSVERLISSSLSVPSRTKQGRNSSLCMPSSQLLNVSSGSRCLKRYLTRLRCASRRSYHDSYHGTEGELTCSNYGGKKLLVPGGGIEPPRAEARRIFKK
jgi:hypothetical protein